MKKNKKFEIIEESRFLSKKEMDKSVGGILVCGQGKIYKLCPGGKSFEICGTYFVNPCAVLHLCTDYILCIINGNGSGHDATICSFREQYNIINPSD